MKMEIKINGCPFEESESFNVFVHALDIQAALNSARENIRNALKYSNISETHESHLEELLELLYVEGIEN